jgi:hypothetical protein
MVLHFGWTATCGLRVLWSTTIETAQSPLGHSPRRARCRT